MGPKDQKRQISTLHEKTKIIHKYPRLLYTLKAGQHLLYNMKFLLLPSRHVQPPV